MIKMSQPYNDTLPCMVEYTNLPKGKIMADNYDSILYIKHTAKGFRMFSLKYLKAQPHIFLNLNDLKSHKSRYTYNSYILTGPLEETIIKQLGIIDEFQGIYPDTLFFALENITSKKLPVNPNITYTLKKQYQIYGKIITRPDSIIIEGIPSIIDTIQYINTEKKKLNEIYEDKLLKLQLIKPLQTSKIRLSNDSVNVIITVEKYTEASISVDLYAIGADTLKLKLFPDKVTITYLVALKDYDKISPTMFTAVVELDKKYLKRKTLKIRLEHYPKFVKVKEIQPERVEYIILR